jgi:hypothetical protein
MGLRIWLATDDRGLTTDDLRSTTAHRPLNQKAFQEVLLPEGFL